MAWGVLRQLEKNYQEYIVHVNVLLTLLYKDNEKMGVAGTRKQFRKAYENLFQ